jgi:hypothetical protein
MRPRFALISIVLWGPALCAVAAPPPAKDVAHSVLYNENGRPIREAFNSALEKRFPVGSSLSVLADFFQKLGGFCAKNSDGITFRCEADIEICQNTIIARVEAKDDVITRVQTVVLALKTCN